MENLIFKFNELIKCLILLKSNYDRQIEYSGNIIPFGDDVIDDFDQYYSQIKFDLISEKFISKEQSTCLDELNQFVEERSGENFIEFWTDNELLKTHTDWEKIRSLAANCLVALNKEKLEIHFENNDSLEKNLNGNELIVRSVNIQFITDNKNDF